MDVRPPPPRPDVTIALDSDVLGVVRVDTGFKPYTLAIPPAVAARLSGGKAANRVVHRNDCMETGSRPWNR